MLLRSTYSAFIALCTLGITWARPSPRHESAELSQHEPTPQMLNETDQRLHFLDRRYKVTHIYSPENWVEPPTEEGDAPLNPVKMIPADNERTVLNYCGRWGGWMDATKWTGVHYQCYQDKDVFSSDPASKTAGSKISPGTAVDGWGPCVQPGNRAYGNQRAGWWPGKDVNCVLFYTDNCQYSYTDKSGKFWPEAPTVVLQPKGMAALERGWWQDKEQNKVWASDTWRKGDGGASGPFSYQCFPRGNKAQGLGGSPKPSKTTSSAALPKTTTAKPAATVSKKPDAVAASKKHAATASKIPDAAPLVG